jgi:hypothetical protein
MISSNGIIKKAMRGGAIKNSLNLLLCKTRGNNCESVATIFNIPTMKSALSNFG